MGSQGGRMYGFMNPTALENILIPLVAILSTFGFPVALIFVWKWFKFKERELQLDAEMRRTSGQALEARVQRLESIILALDADLRAKLGPPKAELYQAPASSQSEQPAGPARREKIE